LAHFYDATMLDEVLWALSVQIVHLKHIFDDLVHYQREKGQLQSHLSMALSTSMIRLLLSK
jgi:hypothetical protein